MGDFERPNSEQLIDLHVYIVPPDLWRTHLRSAVNQIIDETISAGFIRVHPETSVNALRKELEIQLEYDNTDYPMPTEYVFLKCVGRCLTQVKPRQEYTLKVKNFQLPTPGRHPQTLMITPRSQKRHTFAAEIYILDAVAAGVRYTPYSGSSSQSSSVRYNGTPRSDRSEFSGHKPIPPIRRSNISTQTSESDAKSYKPQSTTKAAPNIFVNEPSSATSKGTQCSDPLSPHPYNTNPSNVEAPSYEARFDQLESPVEAETQKTKHVAFTTPTVANHRYFTPQSASPTNTPDTSFGSSRNTQPVPVPQHHNQHLHHHHQQEQSLQHQQRQQQQNEQLGQQRGSSSEYLPPLSATPPLSADHSQNAPNYNRSQPNSPQHSPRQRYQSENLSASRSGSQEMDPISPNAGISDGPGLSDEEQRKLEELLRQKTKSSHRLKREEEEEAERRRREWEEEQERKRREEEERLRLMEDEDDEEEERRRREEELRLEEARRLEEERRRREEEERKKKRSGGRSLSELREELERVRHERLEAEKRREDLVKKARMLQNKAQQRRNQARDIWKKKYFEEKKKTAPLEEQCNKLRAELEALHRRIMAQLEGSKESLKRPGDNKPSPQNNLRIQAARLQHDIDDIQRRVENVKMKLTTEMKLKNQAEGELKALRAELTQKKINMTLARSQPYTPVPMLTPRS